MELWLGNENMEAFHKMEKKLLKKHYGKIAVFANGKLVAIGNDLEDGVKKAKKVSKERKFFVKELFKPEEQVEAILKWWSGLRG